MRVYFQLLHSSEVHLHTHTALRYTTWLDSVNWTSLYRDCLARPGPSQQPSPSYETHFDLAPPFSYTPNRTTNVKHDWARQWHTRASSLSDTAVYQSRLASLPTASNLLSIGHMTYTQSGQGRQSQSSTDRPWSSGTSSSDTRSPEWSEVVDPVERRKIQNKLAQQRFSKYFWWT